MNLRIFTRFPVRWIGGLILLLFVAVIAPRETKANSWYVGSNVGLAQGTHIYQGNGYQYACEAIAPDPNWLVQVIGGPRSADGQTWWDVSRAAIGDPSGGTGWVAQAEADGGGTSHYPPCSSGGGGPTPTPGGGGPTPTPGGGPTPPPVPSGPCANGQVLQDFGTFNAQYPLDYIPAPFFTLRLDATAAIGAQLCPEAPIHIGVNPLAEFTTHSGATTIHSDGSIQTPLLRTNSVQLSGRYYGPTSGAVVIEQESRLTGPDAEVNTSFGFENRVTLENNLRFVRNYAIIAAASALTVRLVAQYGPTAVRFIRGLAGCLLSELNVCTFASAPTTGVPAALHRGSGLAAPTGLQYYNVTASPPAPAVVDDLRATLGQETVNNAILDQVVTPRTLLGPGQRLTYQAAHLTPGGEIDVVLLQVGTAHPLYEELHQASSTGTLTGQIRLPTSMPAGRWLLVLLDNTAAHQVLTEFAQGSRMDLPYTIWATTITVPAYTQVTLDIKPGDSQNRVNLRAQGVLPVAILTTPTFDARTVAPLTLGFGPDAIPEAHARGHWEDVDNDGDVDLMLHFSIPQLGIELTDTEACVFGQTTGGAYILGCDRIAPQRP